jgi:hypothetical protein
MAAVGVAGMPVQLGQEAQAAARCLWVIPARQRGPIQAAALQGAGLLGKTTVSAGQYLISPLPMEARVGVKVAIPALPPSTAARVVVL